MRSRLTAAALVLGAMTFALVAEAGPARANGVPQLVKLTYLAGVSNFGPTDGEGVLEFSFAEAYARVELKNLAPQTGYTYEGWLTGGGGAPFRVGPLPVEASGVGSVETKLEALDRYDYDMFVVAARPDGDPGTALPADRSIAGRFTVISDAPADTDGGDIRPGLLPDTGEVPPDSGPSWSMVLGAMAAMAVVASSGAWVLRRRNRR